MIRNPRVGRAVDVLVVVDRFARPIADEWVPGEIVDVTAEGHNRTVLSVETDHGTARFPIGGGLPGNRCIRARPRQRRAAAGDVG